MNCSGFRKRWSYWLYVWLAAAGCVVVPPAAAQTKQPVAVIAGEAIYEDDLAPLIEGPMQNLRRQEYELRSKALENLLQQKLLQAEAAKRSISVAQLLEQEADAKVSFPTDAEVEAFYMAQKDRINRPLEEIRFQIREALRQGKVQQARQAYLETLKARADVAIYLAPPKIEVSYDSARVRGDADAPVTIVEFSDFQCPFCERAYPVIKELLSKYEGRVKLAYRDFPLRDIHPQAQGAAEASRCAGEQGKFWPYHDRLFEKQRELDRPALGKHAEDLGLDRNQFDDCMAIGKFRVQIEQDMQDASRAGVTGTPAFFINGVAVTGALPLAAFEKVVEEELAAVRKSRGAQQ